jgi:lipoprotein signal peptidase
MSGTEVKPAESVGPLPRDEELAQLRAEVARLRAQSTASDGSGGVAVASKRHGWWRTPLVVVLILIAGVLAPASIVARWAKDTVSDTDRYVQTVAPLANDPAIQQAIVNRVTGEIFSRVDVRAVTQDAIDSLAAQGLPPRVSNGLSALAAPLAGGVRSFVTTQVTKLVESNAFADAWSQANRQAHTQLVAVLTGDGSDAVSVADGAVTLNLGPIIETVKQKLSAAGFTLAEQIPAVNAEFTIFQSANLSKAQSAFSALENLATWLPVLALLLLALAVYVARSRRKTLVASALVVAASMLLLGAALNIFRPMYLDALDSRVQSIDAAAAVYDQLVGFIRLNLRAVLVVALAVAIGAWMTGPSGAGARQGVSRSMGWLRGGAENAGLNTGPVGAFVYGSRTVLRSAIVGIAALVYLLQAHPTGASALTILVVTVLALLLVEFLARPPVVASAPLVDGAHPAG